MKFILVEELNNETPQEDIDKVKNNTEVTIKEGYDYKQSLINDSSELIEKLNDFLLEFDGENDLRGQEFLTVEELNVLENTLDILNKFHRTYSVYARKKADEFIKNNYKGL